MEITYGKVNQMIKERGVSCETGLNWLERTEVDTKDRNVEGSSLTAQVGRSCGSGAGRWVPMVSECVGVLWISLAF